jgi:hypothetical protein
LDAMRHEGWPGVLVTGSGMIPNFNTLLWMYFRPGGIEYPSLEKPSELIDAVYAACMAIPADKELTDAAARIIYDLCIWAPIEHHGDNYAYTDQVHGLNFSSYSQWGQFDAEKVWMSD